MDGYLCDRLRGYLGVSSNINLTIATVILRSPKTAFKNLPHIVGQVAVLSSNYPGIAAIYLLAPQPCAERCP